MESPAHQKLKILIPTNPFSHSEETIKFLFSNIDYGCSGLNLDVDIEIINWQAQNLYDELVGNIIDNDDGLVIQKKLSNLHLDFIDEIRQTYKKQKKLFKSIFKKNKYQNLKSITVTENFDYWYKSYGAVFQFKQIHNKILNHINYDFICFISTNYIINYKYYFRDWINKFSYHNSLPIYHPLVNFNYHNREEQIDMQNITYNTGNVNTFMCRPVIYKNFWDNTIRKFVDVDGYETYYDENFDLGSVLKDINNNNEFSFVKNSKVIDAKNHINSISIDEILSKKYFPLFNTTEPTVSFFYFYFTLLIRNPDIFNLETKNIEGYSIPNCLLECVEDYTSNTGYERCQEFYEPLRTHEYWSNFLNKKINFDLVIGDELYNINKSYQDKIKILNKIYKKYYLFPSISVFTDKYVILNESMLEFTMDSYQNSQRKLLSILKKTYL